MKRILTLALAVMMAVGLTACGGLNSGNDEKETVTITALNAAGEKAELEVPYNPQRVAILDMAVLDILDNFDLGDRVVGTADTSLDYLKDYVTKEGMVNLGTIKEADLEAVMACEPDIIFIGGRLSKSYDALSEIAPVVYLATDVKAGLVESILENAKTIATIFGKEEEVEEKLAGYTARIEKLAEFAEDKNAVLGMATSGSFNLLGNDGRCSLIVNEVGFENIGLSAISKNEGESGSRGGSGSQTTATHGNEASFELLVKLNPQYIFVMDRDAAIGTEGAQLAQDILENELVMKTDAYKNNQIVYLKHPSVWYTAEGGISALEIMLEDLETALFAE